MTFISAAARPLGASTAAREQGTHDTGAKLSRALVSYLVVLIATLSLLPFEFAMPEQLALTFAVSPMSTLAAAAMFVPYGFLSRRATIGTPGAHTVWVVLAAMLLGTALEAAQLFEPARQSSPVHVLANMIGAGVGSVLCARAARHGHASAGAVSALLLQLPLMGLAYLLLPLMWASGASAHDDPKRLVLTLCIGLTGASILGSVARAVRGYTPDRPWWAVTAVAATWVTVGLAPSALLDWRMTAITLVSVTAFAAWRGRWSAPAFTERRYEVPSMQAALPFMLLYLIGAGIWPGQSFRSMPLVQLGVPTTEAGLALALPLLEAGIAATVLGYVIAEFHGREEGRFRAGISRVMFWSVVLVGISELSRSFFGYEGASVSRATMSLIASAYGAWLYHLQRAHVKTVVRRVNGTH